VPHIHWRRLDNKVAEISEDSAARKVHRHADAQAYDNMVVDSELVRWTGDDRRVNRD